MTSKSVSISVVAVSIKYRFREENCAAKKLDPTTNFDLMTWD